MHQGTYFLGPKSRLYLIYVRQDIISVANDIGIHYMVYCSSNNIIIEHNSTVLIFSTFTTCPSTPNSSVFERKSTRAYVCVCVCVCVFFPFILGIKFVGRTSRGHTGGRSHRIGFLIHLLSAVRALIFLARRIQLFLSLVDREVDFWILTI